MAFCTACLVVKMEVFFRAGRRRCWNPDTWSRGDIGQNLHDEGREDLLALVSARTRHAWVAQCEHAGHREPVGVPFLAEHEIPVMMELPGSTKSFRVVLE